MSQILRQNLEGCCMCFEAEVDECGVDEHLLDGEANVTCEG